jgi:hypothetical protein
MYYFVRWKHTENGYTPALPDDVGFMMLAEPGRASDGASFALFECNLPDGYRKSAAVKPVAPELVELLDSAKDYPPALALARDEVADEVRSEDTFAKKLAERLIYHLERQVNSPFFLAKAVVTESFYKEAGGYYWIVGHHNGQVKWVSRDYHVYRDSISDFDLDSSELTARFNQQK